MGKEKASVSYSTVTMSDSEEFNYNLSTQKGWSNSILLVSMLVQTILFIYHYYKHDRSSKLPSFHEWAELFAVVFFIIAITLTELRVPWNHWMMIDIRLDAFVDVDEKYNYVIEW